MIPRPKMQETTPNRRARPVQAAGRQSTAANEAVYSQTVKWAVAFLLCAGCAQVVNIPLRLTRAAQVPVRAFPRVLVVADPTDESAQVAAHLVAHLGGGRSRVREVSRRRARELVRTGTLRPGTILVHVRAELISSERPTVVRRRELECGPLGCVDRQRSRFEAVPVLTGYARLTVVDGVTGRRLQREEVSASETSDDPMGMRLRVLERLLSLTAELVDPQVELQPVELLPTELPEVQAAVRELRGGHATRARRRLTRLVRSDHFSALPLEVRAQVLFDLGQAHRLDVGVPAALRFRRSHEALRAAVRLVPEPRFARALDQLESQRRSRAEVLAQERATAHNYGIARDAAEGRDRSVPNAPTGYR